MTTTEQTNKSFYPENIKSYETNINIQFYLFSIVYVRVSFNITNNVSIADKAPDKTFVCISY